MIKEAINTLVNGKDLTDEVMTQVMEEIMTTVRHFRSNRMSLINIKRQPLREASSNSRYLSSPALVQDAARLRTQN